MDTTANGRRSDPFTTSHFMLELNSTVYGLFRECTGLSSEIAVLDHAEGGARQMGKIPGRVSYPNITLRWGLSDARDAQELYNWHHRAAQGDLERRSGSIVVLNRKGEERVRWNFFDAWPSRWTAPDFNATSDDIAIETLELVVERVERVRIGASPSAG